MVATCHKTHFVLLIPQGIINKGSFRIGSIVPLQVDFAGTAGILTVSSALKKLNHRDIVVIMDIPVHRMYFVGRMMGDGDAINLLFI